jgi:hypothetical protein
MDARRSGSALAELKASLDLGAPQAEKFTFLRLCLSGEAISVENGEPRVMIGRTSHRSPEQPFAPHADGKRFEILEQGRSAADRRRIS